jgi:hypothetical protein
MAKNGPYEIIMFGKWQLQIMDWGAAVIINCQAGGQHFGGLSDD